MTVIKVIKNNKGIYEIHTQYGTSTGLTFQDAVYGYMRIAKETDILKFELVKR